MPKINTSGWGEFRLGKLLNLKNGETKGTGIFNIVNSVAYHGKDIKETNEDTLDTINYATRSKFNNGIKCKVIKKDSYIINPAGTISFGAENADFFYQTEEYITGNKMYYIDTSALSKYSCAFLKSVLEATFTANFSFSDGMTPTRIYDAAIKLPIDSQGNPNWQYMEEYMRNIEVRVKDSLLKLESAKDVENNKIDISSWGEFRLGKLFNPKNCETKGTGIFNILNSVAYHGKDIEETDGNDINGLSYVTRSKFNNGIKCKVINKDYYVINPAGTISFGAENADFFYQTEEYITGNKMYYIDTSDLSNYSCAFIKSVLEATFTANFSFSDGMVPARIYDEIIKLPIDSNGNPDWQYMEEYMRNIEVRVCASLLKLAHIDNEDSQIKR